MNAASRTTCNFVASVLLGGALLSTPAAADQTTTIRRIGVLTAPSISSVEQGFRDGLRDLGYIEGRNLIIEWRRSLGNNEELRSLAVELASAKVELIVAFSTPPAKAALAATSLPVVFAAGDPVASGLAASLSKPGGNGTGISSVTTDLTPKRVEFLQHVAPGIRRIAYLENSSNPTRAQLAQQARMAARALGVQLESVDARDVHELDNALRTMRRTQADAILISGDFLFLSNRAKVTRAVRETKLPAMFPWREYHDEGALMSYGVDLYSQSRLLAGYVDKVLKGAKPANLPIEQQSKYVLIIDLQVARTLGLKVPQDLLLRADEVIR